MTAPDPTEPSTVTLTIPADVRFFRPVRLAVGGLATLVGFDVEAIDDLRIGVDELCAALVESGDGGDLHIDVVADIGRTLRIDGSTSRGPIEVDVDRFRFSTQILSVVSDDYGYEIGDTQVRCWLERAHLLEADDAART